MSKGDIKVAPDGGALSLSGQLPDDDVRYAGAHALLFYAATKERRHARWVPITADVPLDEAMNAALAAQAYERAVFVRTPTGGGFYWTSSDDLFESGALRGVVRERLQGGASE